MKFYELTNYGKTYNVYPEIGYYSHGNTLAVSLIADNEEPYCNLTVNIPDSIVWASDTDAFVDTNNCPWAEQFITENGLGSPLGYVGHSGFCSYPLYHFNLDELQK